MNRLTRTTLLLSAIAIVAGGLVACSESGTPVQSLDQIVASSTTSAPITTTSSTTMVQTAPSTDPNDACAHLVPASRDEAGDGPSLKSGYSVARMYKYEYETPSAARFFVSDVVDSGGRTVATGAVWTLQARFWAGENDAANKYSDEYARHTRAFPEENKLVIALAQCPR